MLNKKKKTKLSNETFFMTFIGEYVAVMTDLKTTESQTTEEGTLEVTQPFTFHGFLLDMDDEYFYFGSESNEISSVLPKSMLKFMSVAEMKNEFDEILDSMEDPKNESEFN